VSSAAFCYNHSGYGLLLSLLLSVGAPVIVLLPLELLGGSLYLGLVFWMVVDVIDSEAGFLWLLVFFLCFGPLVVIAHMLWGRS
jgi:hypothetical protein